MTGPDRCFPELDPPPDGLRGLRARLDRPRLAWWPWLLLLAGAAAALLLLWPRAAALPPLDAGLVAAVSPPTEPVTVPPHAVGRVAVARVPAEIVWYRVAAIGEP